MPDNSSNGPQYQYLISADSSSDNNDLDYYKNTRGLFGLIQLYKDPKTGELREQAIVDDFNEYTDLISLISYLFSPIIGGITGYFSVKEKPRNADAVIAEIENKYRIMDRDEFMEAMHNINTEEDDMQNSEYNMSYSINVPFAYESDDFNTKEDNTQQQDPYSFVYA